MLSSLPVFWSEQVRTFLLIGWWDGIIVTTKRLLYTIYTGHCGVGQLNPTKCEIVLLGQAGTRGCLGVKCFSLKPGKFNYLNRTFELRTMILDIFILLTRCDGRRQGRNWFEFHDWNSLCYSFECFKCFNIQQWSTFHMHNAKSKYEDKFVTSCSLASLRPRDLNRFKPEN